MTVTLSNNSGAPSPSSSTSGVGDTDFCISSLSEQTATVSLKLGRSNSSSLIPAELFLSFFSFLRPLFIPRIPLQIKDRLLFSK